mgnify:CR=1 FL=1
MGQRDLEKGMNKLFLQEDLRNAGEEICITGPDAHHLRDVLRMRPGELFLASCGNEWEYTCRVESIGEGDLRASIVDAQKPGRELPSRIVLMQCLPKGDKMETVVRKAVELGAAEIVPVTSSRCVVKLDAKKAEAKGKRWNAVSKSAAKQAKRMVIPAVHRVLGFPEALQYAGRLKGRETDAGPVLLMPYENAQGMEGTRQLLSSIQPGQPVVILIGPEGGFSPNEVLEIKSAGGISASLGKRILKTDTAAISVLAMINYEYFLSG